MTPSSRDRFLVLLRTAIDTHTLQKLTLGKYRGPDASLRNLFVRPVTLKSGPHLTFLWRHATRDVTKNHAPAAALAELERLIGADFLDAHLFTSAETAQLECQPGGKARLRIKPLPGAATPSPRPVAHDRAKAHLIPAAAPWLRALGVTNDRGVPREGMADKFRQIQKFAEVLSHLLNESVPGWSGLPPTRSSSVDSTPLSAWPGASSPLPSHPSTLNSHPSTPNSQLSTPNSQLPSPLRIVDMGCGKGYLTFAIAALLGERARVVGIELRAELVDAANRIAREHHLDTCLHFTAGTIASTALSAIDVLIALHACDTATDDALAKGLAAGAQLLVVSPCCQKELRPQLTAPAVLADALRHGIFQERQAEFVTDALRAQLLEWAGYRTRVFEFISTEHTAKNLMITAVKAHAPGDADRAQRIREFARFYGIRSQQLATHLRFALS